jgi:hypothetical protein
MYTSTSQNCTGSPLGNINYWREVPTSQSGTGGTAILMPDLNFHNGITSNVGGSNASLVGQRSVFGGMMEAAAIGVGAMSIYAVGHNPAAYNSNGTANGNAGCGSSNPPFVPADCTSGLGIQQGAHPYWEDGSGMLVTWHAMTMGSEILHNPHVDKCLYQPRSVAPDLGQYFETSIREGAQSNCLMVVNISDVDQSVTVPLTALQTGNAFMQIIGNWATISNTSLSASSTTATVIVPAGGAAFWIAPVGSDSFSFPKVALRLADVTNATQITAWCSYDALAFAAWNPALVTAYVPPVSNQVLYQTFNLGSGSGTINMDKQQGAIYCQFPYLSSTGAVLSPGSVQQVQ